MKIKLDFVTNSSSTAYVVIAPENIKLLTSEDPLKNLDDYEHEIEMLEQITLEKNILVYVNDNLKTLKEGYGLYHGNCFGFLVTKNYLKKLGYILKEIDVSGNSGCDIIEPLSIESIHKILNRAQANEMEN